MVVPHQANATKIALEEKETSNDLFTQFTLET
jgi:hypothetical protein